MTSAIACARPISSSENLGQIREVMDRVPTELFLKIFEYLSFEDLNTICDPQVSCIYPKWRSIIGNLSEDNPLWKESNLRERFPLLKNIFSQDVWMDLGIPGIRFEGASSLEPRAFVEALAAIRFMPIKDDAGYTLITIPQGLTINKIKALMEDFQARGKFPGIASCWGPVLEWIGDLATDKPYTFVISNSISKGSESVDLLERHRFLETLGCEIPGIREVMTLLFFTYIASGETDKRLYNDNPGIYTTTLDMIRGLFVPVGGFSPDGFHICGEEDRPWGSTLGFGFKKVV